MACWDTWDAHRLCLEASTISHLAIQSACLSSRASPFARPVAAGFRSAQPPALARSGSEHILTEHSGSEQHVVVGDLVAARLEPLAHLGEEGVLRLWVYRYRVTGPHSCSGLMKYMA